MSSCIDIVCGVTGGGNAPVPNPGDPSFTTVALRATAVFGGIQVSWTYPKVLPENLAYTKLYRSKTSDFTTAPERATVSASEFYDQIDDEGTYFYWIRMYSVYGTEGVLIGPASATLRSKSDDIMEIITGEIDAGSLAQGLKERIEDITRNAADIKKEIQDRLNENTALGNSLENLSQNVDNAFGIIDSEIQARFDGQNALVKQYDIIAAANANNAAAITQTRDLVLTENSALAGQINRVEAATGNNQAAIETVSRAVTDLSSATARNLTTVQTELNGTIASVRSGAESELALVNGKIVVLNNKWTAKVDVNGLVGGFGINNDGQTVEAGFDVDRFWIGRTNNKVKPFIVDGGIVYIDSARIRNASIGSAHIADLSVDTLKIANNAVTFPVSSYSVGTTVSTTGGPSIVVNVKGNSSKVMIVCNIIFGSAEGVVSGGSPAPDTYIKAHIKCENNNIKTADTMGITSSVIWDASGGGDTVRFGYKRTGNITVLGSWSGLTEGTYTFRLYSSAGTAYGVTYPTSFYANQVAMVAYGMYK